MKFRQVFRNFEQNRKRNHVGRELAVAFFQQATLSIKGELERLVVSVSVTKNFLLKPLWKKTKYWEYRA